MLSVARVLARAFDDKLRDAVAVGVPTEDLKWLTAVGKSAASIDKVEEENRRDRTSKAETGLRGWRVVNQAKLVQYGGLTAFSPDSSMVLTSTGQEARINELPSGRLIARLPAMYIADAVFSPSRHEVITVSSASTTPEDYVPIVWDATTGEKLRTLEGHTDRVIGAAYSPDGSVIVTTSFDHTYAIWDAATGQQLHRELLNASYIPKPEFSLDGKYFIVHHDIFIELIETKTGAIIRTFDSKDRIVSVSIRNSEIYAIDTSGMVNIFSFSGLEPTFSFQIKGYGKIASIELSPDGSKLIAIDDKSNGGLWDVKTGQPLSYLQFSNARAVFSPDGQQIFIGITIPVPTPRHPRGTPSRIVDAKTGQILSYVGPLENVPRFAYPPDGQSLLTVGGINFNAETKIWQPSRAGE